MTNEKTTVFTGTTLERHNNRIKTEALNEVIEMIKGNIKSGRLGEYEYRNNVYTRGLIKQVQSLLPKEEAKDWSKASDEELKKEAEKLIGKTIVCLVDNKPHVVKQHYNNDPNNTHSDGSIWMDSETLIGSTNEQMGIQVYCRESNQWAEIIPDSQIKEPVKSEPTQEIKVGQDVWLSKQGGFTHTVLSIDGDEAWIKRNHDGYSMVVKVYQIYNYIESDPLQKTQEEMDREKVEEIMSLHFFSKIDEKHREAYPSILLEAINYGRKTKQDRDMKLFKKKYTEKELIAFGNYLLSKQRHLRIKYDENGKVRPNYHDLKKEVHHADVENFKVIKKLKSI